MVRTNGKHHKSSQNTFSSVNMLKNKSFVVSVLLETGKTGESKPGNQETYRNG